MARSTVHYADNKTNNALKKLHNKLRPAGTPVQRVEYIIELLLLRIFETKIKQDDEFKPLRKLFSTDYKWKNPKTGKEESNENRLFSYLPTVSNDQILSELNDKFFPFYSSIMNSARQAFDGNLPQKVQDQLVLIEEVFSNSNFTNNVNSGNLGEVISIVANDIEEVRLLKTDLLGDAIESALSETGGTKDVGLFRTPDHIRQFMTGLIEPTFDDLIFDPACGTGGFLFDAFEFVMRRADPSREWPGEKGHSELLNWFDEYFTTNKIDFPSIEQTTQFYRGGVTGIEYLGMIRKMAAINFYIRGLNPANIEQGDSLSKYSPITDHESKSIILANPPFGAERDQESYPDVWQEYSKESDTTILFVKLMFEQLKQGGQCAVVVAEGFNTWDQFSAKALRKMLLDEAQLKAVISLPQGLFVSKTGQGPKTSILIFEKGGKTDWTWFYKVANDGYSMGTNRKEQKGNQLVECLSLYHKYVKNGIQPPESKSQFCIPVEWIKALDPRIKDKIRKETRADLSAKGKKEKDKKEKELNKKVKAKKIQEEEKQKVIKTFDQMLENRIQNEIAKRIDKAHNYSFNLANYKSTFSEDQITDWHEALKHIQSNGVTKLDDVYKKLKSNKLKNVLPYLLKLDPSNALEADIAKEYITNLEEKVIQEQQELCSINNIIKSGDTYDKALLESVLTQQNIYVTLDEDSRYKRVTCKLWSKGIKLRDRVYGSDLKTKKQQIIQSDQLIVAEMDAKYGGYGIVPEECDNAIVSSHYYLFEIDKSKLLPSYLREILVSDELLQQVKTFVKGTTNYSAIRKNDFLKVGIPLPEIDIQQRIVEKIEKQKAIIEGADKVINNWHVPEELFNIKDGRKSFLMSEICEFKGGSQPPKSDFIYEPHPDYIRLVQIRDFKSDANITYVPKEKVKKLFDKDDIMIARYGPPVFQILRGLSGAYNVALMKAIPKDELVLKDYWFYYLQNPVIQKYVIDNSQRTAGQSGVSLNHLYAFQVFVPNIEEQQKIIDKLDSEVRLLEGLKSMKSEAEYKIEKILAGVWGVEVEEPTKIIKKHE